MNHYVVCSDADHYEELEERAAFEAGLPNETYGRYSPPSDFVLEKHGELRFYIERPLVERIMDQELVLDEPTEEDDG